MLTTQTLLDLLAMNPGKAMSPIDFARCVNDNASLIRTLLVAHYWDQDWDAVPVLLRGFRDDGELFWLDYSLDDNT